MKSAQIVVDLTQSHGASSRLMTGEAPQFDDRSRDAGRAQEKRNRQRGSRLRGPARGLIGENQFD